MKRMNWLNNKEQFFRISKLMENGIQTDATTGLQYFTGYSYCTLYDWDQYFEAICQLYLGWGTNYIKNAVQIFLLHQKENGFIERSIQSIPDQIPSESPEKLEMVKPFLAQITLLCYKEDGHIDWFTPELFEKMKKYLNYWLLHMDENANHLSHWDSAPHSGMDDQVARCGGWMSSFCEGTDLNSFLVRECKAMMSICEINNDLSSYHIFNSHREMIEKSIQELLWCEEDGIFYDLDCRTNKQIKIKSSSCFSPLWAGIATKEQAQVMIQKHLLNPNEFWRNFPIPSYAADEQEYREERLAEDIGCNWRAQTWIPVNYYIMHSLIDYGYEQIAYQLAQKTREMVLAIGDREYYNTDSCSGNGLNPFWGWSLLSYFMPTEAALKYNPTSLTFDDKNLMTPRFYSKNNL